jgi:hypothetical protein
MTSNSYLKTTRSNIQFNYGSNLDNESITISHTNDISSYYNHTGIAIGVHTTNESDLSGTRILIPTKDTGDKNTIILGVTISGERGNNIFDQIPTNNTEGKVHFFTKDDSDNITEAYVNKSTNEIKFLTSNDISLNNTLLTVSGVMDISDISLNNVKIKSNITFNGTVTTSNIYVLNDLSWQTFTDLSESFDEISNNANGGGDGFISSSDLDDLSSNYLATSLLFKTYRNNSVNRSVGSRSGNDLFVSSIYTVGSNINSTSYYMEIPNSSNYIIKYEDMSEGFRFNYGTLDNYFVKMGTSSTLTIETVDGSGSRRDNKFIVTGGYSNGSILLNQEFETISTFTPWTNVVLSNRSASDDNYIRFDVVTYKTDSNALPTYEVNNLYNMNNIDIYGNTP